MKLRLGELLIEHGILDEEQVQAVLEAQERTGKPFGLLCEAMFDVAPARIEEVWSVQYASLTRQIDPATEPFDERALETVTRRQAWQFRILPIRFDGRELMIATTPKHLPRALRFANNVLGLPVYFVMAPAEALGQALSRHYPLPGMDPGQIDAEPTRAAG